MKNQIEAMKKIGMSDAEIESVIEADARIDKGEKLFELTTEQKQAEKKAKGTGTRTVYNFQKRERKADNDKRFLIDSIYWLLTEDTSQNGDNVDADNVEIINPEREIVFTYNDKKYKIVLSAPRS